METVDGEGHDEELVEAEAVTLVQHAVVCSEHVSVGYKKGRWMGSLVKSPTPMGNKEVTKASFDNFD